MKKSSTVKKSILLASITIITAVITYGEDYKLSPLPDISPIQPENSVSIEDTDSFPEIKLADLPSTPGPFQPTWDSIEQNYPGEPSWLRDSKFGIWVHFGPQAAGKSGDWYARKLYVEGTLAYENHLKNYGHPSEVGYKEVLRDWDPSKLDPALLTRIYQDAGAKFLLVQGVHHDNFDLWDSKYQPWNSVNIGPKRDLIGEWAKACKANGMYFGITFHHEYTWWWWQTAFGSDTKGNKKGIPYDGNLTLEDGKGKWWEGLDPRLLYGINLREYKGVVEAANSPWSPPPAGIFKNHIPYAKWYTKQWALRIMDVIDKYDPDFIYTDGTNQQPFNGKGTGTGIKTDATQRVLSYFYNRTLQKHGKVDTFSIIKFRSKTNGTVTSEEFGLPDHIKTDQPWIGEAPVGDWFYAPDFTYNSDMVIRYVIEAISHDGNAAVSIPIREDGSLEKDCLKMLKQVGIWMKLNGEAVYGSHAWKIPGEGEMVNGKLRMLPGGKLGRTHAEFKFTPQDFRFTVGSDGSLYAFCMTIPAPGYQIKIKALGKNSPYTEKKIQSVELLGYRGNLQWQQTDTALEIYCPNEIPCKTSIVFKIK